MSCQWPTAMSHLAPGRHPGEQSSLASTVEVGVPTLRLCGGPLVPFVFYFWLYGATGHLVRDMLGDGRERVVVVVREWVVAGGVGWLIGTRWQ